MPLNNDQKKHVTTGLDAIAKATQDADPAVEDRNRETTARLKQPEKIIDTPAYHDYYRIELGTPVISMQVPDKTVKPKLTTILTVTKKFPGIFGEKATTAEPTDADQVEELLAEIKADLTNMAAGPVPGIVSNFVVNALHDYIDQATWTAMSVSERDRMGQLASAWTALTAPPPPAATQQPSGGGPGVPGLGGGSGSGLPSLPAYVDPGGYVLDKLGLDLS